MRGDEFNGYCMGGCDPLFINICDIVRIDINLHNINQKNLRCIEGTIRELWYSEGLL